MPYACATSLCSIPRYASLLHPTSPFHTPSSCTTSPCCIPVSLCHVPVSPCRVRCLHHVPQMNLLLREYLLCGEVSEAERCLRALEVPHFHHELVYEVSAVPGGAAEPRGPR